MTTRPHDISDLYLSPVALELDGRLGQFEGLSAHDVELRVALAINDQPHDRAERPAVVLRSLVEAVDTHGWEITWASRGLRVSHGEHALVLGVPENLKAYLGN